MQHCTHDELALAALREPLPEPAAGHLASCSPCRDEVRSLQRSVDLLAVPELAAPDGAVAPPPSVWDSIAAATGVTANPRAGWSTEGVQSATPVVLPPAPAAPLPAPAAPPSAPAGDGVVRELRPRRSRVLLAAAASLLVGAGLGAGGVTMLDGDPGTAVAAADLAPLDVRNATGEAEVVAGPDGTAVLEVRLAAPAEDDGYYEVWLIEPAIQRMISVGVVRTGVTTLDLPAGVDLAEYPIVDVSVEPLDGDPTHSGVSVARGVLDL